MSFDDAPTGDSVIFTTKQRSKKIIDALKQSKVEDAIFFVTTNNIKNNGKESIQGYIDAGFHLANHSHSHQSANELSTKDFASDLNEAKTILKQFSNTLPYYRFPFLHYGKDHSAIEKRQEQLHKAGYVNGYVTVDNFDWYINAALNKALENKHTINYEIAEKVYVDVLWQGIEFYDSLARDNLKRSPKHVLLLHENDAAALFLPALIKHIRSQGWKIISPQSAYQDPIAKSLPATDFHKQGRVAALAHVAGVEKEKLRHASENVEYIDNLLHESGAIVPMTAMKSDNE